MRNPPDRSSARAAARGILLGAWCGIALALVIALQQHHGPEYFLVNALLAAVPLSCLGGVVASVIAFRPGPRERLQQLLRQLGRPLTDDDIQSLLIEPAATQ